MKVLFYRMIKNVYGQIGNTEEEGWFEDRSGFTLIELLITLFLAIVLGSIGYLAVTKRMRKERLVSEVTAFSNDLYKMKNKALTENRRSGIRISSDKNYDLVYYDDSGVRHTITTRSLNMGRFSYNGSVTTCPDGSSVDTGDGVNFPDNEIIFLPIGTPTSSGCLLVVAGEYTASVVVTPSGDIRIFVFDSQSNSWIER